MHLLSQVFLLHQKQHKFRYETFGCKENVCLAQEHFAFQNLIDRPCSCHTNIHVEAPYYSMMLVFSYGALKDTHYAVLQTKIMYVHFLAFKFRSVHQSSLVPARQPIQLLAAGANKYKKNVYLRLLQKHVPDSEDVHGL